MNGEELAEEMRSRRMKPGRLKNEQMREILIKEDKCQTQLFWDRGDKEQQVTSNQLWGGSEEESLLE